MAEELTQVRIGTDITIRARLNDSGVYYDFSGEGASWKARLLSMAQNAPTGVLNASPDPEDGTVLIVTWKASDQCFIGDYDLILSVSLNGRTATFEAPAFTLVRLLTSLQSTADQPDGGVSDIAVSLSVESISTSVLTDLLDDTRAAAQEARGAASQTLQTEKEIEEAEQKREEAEQLRQKEFSTLQTESENATSSAKSAASSALSASGRADSSASAAETAARNAQDAAAAASGKASLANTAAQSANSAADAASGAASSATSAAQSATSAASAASSAASSAQTATQNAQSATQSANDAAGAANAAAQAANEAIEACADDIAACKQFDERLKRDLGLNMEYETVTLTAGETGKYVKCSTRSAASNSSFAISAPFSVESSSEILIKTGYNPSDSSHKPLDISVISLYEEMERLRTVQKEDQDGNPLYYEVDEDGNPTEVETTENTGYIVYTTETYVESRYLPNSEDKFVSIPNSGYYVAIIPQACKVVVSYKPGVTDTEVIIVKHGALANIASQLFGFYEHRTMVEAMLNLAARVASLESRSGNLGNATAGMLDVIEITRYRYPTVLYGHGVPAADTVPVNLPEGLPWDGVPVFIGQLYINLDAASEGLYYATGHDSLSEWKQA